MLAELLEAADQVPRRVGAQVHLGLVFSVTNTTAREVEWVTRDMGRVFPAQWARFRDGVPADQRDGNLALAYSRLLHDPDPAVREQAARDWCDWEDTHVATHPGYKPDTRFQDPVFRLRFARLVTHYWAHAAWIEDGALLRDAYRLVGIPGVLVHGVLDVSGPADTAWKLAQVWPDAELHLIDGVGHGLGAPGMADLVVRALDKFGRLGKFGRPASSIDSASSIERVYNDEQRSAGWCP